AVRHGDGDHDFTLLRKLDGVPHEVEQDLAESSRIATEYRTHVRVHQAGQIQPFAERTLGEQLQRLVHRSAQVKVDELQGQLAGFNLGKVENIVDDGKQVPPA